MNHIKLKQKIMIIFVVCILIPMITTNGFIFWMMRENMHKDQERNIEAIAERIAYEMKDAISKQLLIADYLNRNTVLNEFLDQEYSSNAEYYEAYVDLLEDDIIHHYYTVQSVYNISICTDNPTIVNGNYFLKRSEIEDSQWYQEFINSGRRICLYSYYEDGQESGGYVEKGRRFIIMRKMDYCNYDSVLILELDYLALLEKLAMTCEETDGYIFTGEQMLFSTLEQNNKKQMFQGKNAYEKKGYEYSKEFELYGKTFEIRLTTGRPSIWGIFKEHIGYMILIYVLNLVLPTLLIYIVYRSFYDRVAVTQEYMDKVKNGTYEEISCDEGSDEIGSMIRTYNLMVNRIKELIEVVFKNKVRQQDLEIARKQAELNALQSQLNPHFIFNALESIRMHSILKKEKETAKILESFAILMRKNIQWDKDFVSIEEECDNVRRYLEIQKYRFGDRLEFSLYVQEECNKRKIPKFIIITFVENACVHGIERSVDGGSVTVMVSEDEERLYFEIMDSGSGMNEEELARLKAVVKSADITDIQKAKKSIGIINAVVRMKQYYGESVQIDINSTVDGGTEVCICLQKEPKEAE